MTTPTPETLTLAELTDAQLPPAPPDPEWLPDLGPEHRGCGQWGTPLGELWGQTMIAHACVQIWWQTVREVDEQEHGPETRRDLVHVYVTEYGLPLAEAFSRASAFMGPRTEAIRAKAVALADAARAAMDVLAADDETLIPNAYAQLSAALDTESEN